MIIEIDPLDNHDATDTEVIKSIDLVTFCLLLGKFENSCEVIALHILSCIFSDMELVSNLREASNPFAPDWLRITLEYHPLAAVTSLGIPTPFSSIFAANEYQVRFLKVLRCIREGTEVELSRDIAAASCAREQLVCLLIVLLHSLTAIVKLT